MIRFAKPMVFLYVLYKDRFLLNIGGQPASNALRCAMRAGERFTPDC